MAELVLQNVTVSLKDMAVARDIHLTVRPGELVALLGPNGVGKTSLLRAAAGLLPAISGRVRLGAEDPRTMPAAARARRLAYLPQERPVAWPLRVCDVVALGRFAHGGRVGRLQKADQEAVVRALATCGLESLTERAVSTLSGGERARVHLARAFAAEAPLLLADEPAAALDPHHQWRVMRSIRTYVNAGGAALVVLHDVALAASFADRLAWMSHGTLWADGTPAETLTAARLREVYGIDADVTWQNGAASVTVTGLTT